MSTQRIQGEARRFALQNAVFFNGKANEKAVVGKVIAALKKDGVTPAEIIPVVSKVVVQVNAMSVDDQLAELTKLAPELLQKEKKEKDFSLPPLPFAEKGKVVTRFPQNQTDIYISVMRRQRSLIPSTPVCMMGSSFYDLMTRTRRTHSWSFMTHRKKTYVG
jgi:hypothetical protein